MAVTDTVVDPAREWEAAALAARREASGLRTSLAACQARLAVTATALGRALERLDVAEDNLREFVEEDPMPEARPDARDEADELAARISEDLRRPREREAARRLEAAMLVLADIDGDQRRETPAAVEAWSALSGSERKKLRQMHEDRDNVLDDDILSSLIRRGIVERICPTDGQPFTRPTWAGVIIHYVARERREADRRDASRRRVA